MSIGCEIASIFGIKPSFCKGKTEEGALTKAVVGGEVDGAVGCTCLLNTDQLRKGGEDGGKGDGVTGDGNKFDGDKADTAIADGPRKDVKTQLDLATLDMLKLDTKVCDAKADKFITDGSKMDVPQTDFTTLDLFKPDTNPQLDFTALDLFKPDAQPKPPYTIWQANYSSNYDIQAPIVADLNNDGKLEVITLTRTGGTCGSAWTDQEIIVFDNVGTVLKGWPKKTKWNFYFTNDYDRYVAGDIVGSADKEIVVSDLDAQKNSWIYAYQVDGTIVSGWPVKNPSSNPLWQLHTTVKLADLDGDKKNEVVVLNHSDIIVFNGSGKQLNSINTGSYGSSRLALGDIDNDGQMEMVGEQNWNGYNLKLHAWKLNGSEVKGFPLSLNKFLSRGDGAENSSYSEPQIALADFDNDGKLDIFTQAKQDIAIYSNGGVVKFSWVLKQKCGILKALGDVNSDGKIELLFAYDCHYSTPGVNEQNVLYDYNGNTLKGWPHLLGANEWFYPDGGTAVMANIDTDPYQEILVGIYNQQKNRYYIRVLSHDGSKLYDIDYNPTGIVVANPFIIGDFDNNGKTQLLVTTGWYCQNDLLFMKISFSNAPSKPQIEWPMYRHDSQSTWNYEYK